MTVMTPWLEGKSRTFQMYNASTLSHFAKQNSSSMWHSRPLEVSLPSLWLPFRTAKP